MGSVCTIALRRSPVENTDRNGQMPTTYQVLGAWAQYNGKKSPYFHPLAPLSSNPAEG